MGISVRREVLANMLREHGEDDLAQRALTSSDDELARIGTLGAYYAWSEDAMTLGVGLGGARALSLATIDVLEENGRGLRRYSTDAERAQGCPEQPSARERAGLLELRRHAAEQQVPADKSERTLDTVDPPAWGPAPADATVLVKRCHELRTKPLTEFTAEDLRIVIGQQVALGRMVALSFDRLQPDPLVEDDFPADLLASVLQVDPAFWEKSPDLDLEVRKLAERLDERLELEPALRELIKTFIRDHSARRIALRARLAREPLDDWWTWST